MVWCDSHECMSYLTRKAVDVWSEGNSWWSSKYVLSLSKEGKKITLVPLSPSQRHKSKPQQIHKHLNLLLNCHEPLLAVQDEYKAFKTRKGLFRWLVIFQPSGFKSILGRWLSGKFEGKFSSTRGGWWRSLHAPWFRLSKHSRKDIIISQSSRKDPRFVRVQNITQIHFSKTARFCSSSYLDVLEV